jgi:putative inorganic carbon (HCO3(-)) transporter
VKLAVGWFPEIYKMFTGAGRFGPSGRHKIIATDCVRAMLNYHIQSTFRRSNWETVAYGLAFGSVTTILFSIALSQLLLGLAFATLVLSGRDLKFPPVKTPLLLFGALTVISLLLSGDPVHGLPQIRKFYVFLTLPVVYSAFRSMQDVRLTVVTWSAIAFLSALRSGAQYVHRYHLAEEQYAYNYGFFLDGRFTGFASHWMTFGGEQMVVLLMLLALLLFCPARRRLRWLGFSVAVVLWASVVLGLTRSIFLLGLPAGCFYLLWKWKRPVAFILPALIILELLFGPVQVRERVVSAIRPHEELDSNAHRILTRKVGWAMIRAHPWFGVGPEQVGRQFTRYLPEGTPQPLPKGFYGHLHNIYLQFGAERGIPALGVLLWFIGRVLRDFYRGAHSSGNNSPQAQFALHGGIAVTIAVLLEGCFEHNLGDSEILTLFLTVVAFGYIALERVPFERQLVSVIASRQPDQLHAVPMSAS